MSAATEEIKLRVAPETKRAIQHAAEIKGETVSEFVRHAADVEAERVLADVRFRQTTTLPPSFFDEFVAALDEPGRAVPSLVEAVKRLEGLDLD